MPHDSHSYEYQTESQHHRYHSCATCGMKPSETHGPSWTIMDHHGPSWTHGPHQDPCKRSSKSTGENNASSTPFCFPTFERQRRMMRSGALGPSHSSHSSHGSHDVWGRHKLFKDSGIKHVHPGGCTWLAWLAHSNMQIRSIDSK
jgi:hypothetical protein